MDEGCPKWSQSRERDRFDRSLGVRADRWWIWWGRW